MNFSQFLQRKLEKKFTKKIKKSLYENLAIIKNSCLENPVARGACWAAVHGVAQSWTGPKQLSMHACIGVGNGNPLQYSCLENPREEPGGLPSLGFT